MTAPSVPAQPTKPVQRVGRFRVVGRIARGGMAEIFVARPEDPESTDAGAEVALKRLLPELRRDKEFTDMFRDEANLASRLDHPNIVRILEVGTDPGDPDSPVTEHAVPFIAMELLRGVNLRDLLARLQTLGRSLPVELGVFAAIGALRGLRHAHGFTDEAGRPLRIVHRDVSPQNVILTYDGAVKLVDFGVAKAEGRLHQTRAGLIKGKFAYMSPEQVDGAELDGRSDLFTLGEVFYELLLRRHPFYAASDMDVLRKIVDEDPLDPRELEPDFPDEPAEALLKAMQKRPEDRFKSADAMLNELGRWLSAQPHRPTSGELAGLVRELFSDRRLEEEQARQRGDDRALVDALRVGRAAQVGLLAPPPQGPSRSVRSSPQRAAPAQEPTSSLVSEDNEDLPTMLLDGTAGLVLEEGMDGLSEDGETSRANIPVPRAAEPQSRPIGRPRRPGSVLVAPAAAKLSRPRIVPSERAGAVADPAEHRASTPSDQASPRPRPAQGPRPNQATRASTVRRESPTALSLGGRFDLVVFAVGLLALIGALIFALEPFAPSSPPHPAPKRAYPPAPIAEPQTQTSPASIDERTERAEP